MSTAQFQLFGDLPAADYEALKADIAKRGVLVPVELDEDGNILDGHHRVRACQELQRTSYPRVVRSGMTEAEKRSHVRALNIHRRHLTSEQKRQVIAEELRENPEQSNREVARVLGVDHKTVASVRQEQQSTGEIPQLNRTVGRDGKSRPATKRRCRAPLAVIETARDVGQPHKPTTVIERLASAAGCLAFCVLVSLDDQEPFGISSFWVGQRFPRREELRQVTREEFGDFLTDLHDSHERSCVTRKAS